MPVVLNKVGDFSLKYTTHSVDKKNDLRKKAQIWTLQRQKLYLKLCFIDLKLLRGNTLFELSKKTTCTTKFYSFDPVLSFCDQTLMEWVFHC